MPPPSTDGADNGKQRQLMFITLNDQILSQILATGGKGLKVTFAGSSAVSLLLSSLPLFSVQYFDCRNCDFAFYVIHIC